MDFPSFREDQWLPEGHFSTSWEEIEIKFGGEAGSQRRKTIRLLLDWRDAARAKGLSGRIILNGSFISAKENPGDFDLLFLFDMATENLVREDSEALELIDPLHCKRVYGGDVFAFSARMASDYPHFFPMDTFDRIKFTDVKKGVLEVEL